MYLKRCSNSISNNKNRIYKRRRGTTTSHTYLDTCMHVLIFYISLATCLDWLDLPTSSHTHTLTHSRDLPDHLLSDIHHLDLSISLAIAFLHKFLRTCREIMSVYMHSSWTPLSSHSFIHPFTHSFIHSLTYWPCSVDDLSLNSWAHLQPICPAFHLN